jgi:hypothetical protein
LDDFGIDTILSGEVITTLDLLDIFLLGDDVSDDLSLDFICWFFISDCYQKLEI